MFLKFILCFALLLLAHHTSLITRSTGAVYDPLAVPNNRFGIHIISATPDESSPAADLVNSSGGDWGYVTVLIESKDRNKQKWQAFFDDLRRRHIIPIVRLATQPEGSYWKRPYEGEEEAWADFLDSLNWPVKNRYVVIYNEPNHATEWGNFVDPESYAKVLDKTISALKKKSDDFFVLNAGFDVSTPHKPPQYFDALTFMHKMEESVPGIFTKLDGWTSHSYPNPNFSGSPNAAGRGTLRTYLWENQTVKQFGVTGPLPIFITETGWKHAEGIKHDRLLPAAETVGDYFKIAFRDAFSNNKIAAITPFLLNYQEEPFDHFSFKKITGEGQSLKILGAQFPLYYPHYQTIMELPKIKGRPVQDKKSEFVSGEIYKSLVEGEKYSIQMAFKNSGQSIWNEFEPIQLKTLSGGQLNIKAEPIAAEKKVEPGGQHIFDISLEAPASGIYYIKLALFEGDKPFDSPPLEFTTQVKKPVILKVKTSLLWKNSFSGDYKLQTGAQDQLTVNLNKQGYSDEIESRHLLPDYTMDFTLFKPYYKPKKINVKLVSGINILDFEKLEPDFKSVLFNPVEFWKLLPWSN